MTFALDGVKIADFSWVGAGPRATKDLADNGAEVIKIESRKRLDLGRMSPPFKDGKRDPDGSAFFAITNTSKKSVTINLADPRGVAVAKKLIAWADVVVENFGKGFLDRIGLSFEDMKAIKPDVILVSVSVAGRTGPLADFRGYGNAAAALSGQAALAGWPDRPPHMPPFAYGDVVAPLFATVAVLAALEHRAVTGQGQHIDVSQVEPLIHTLADVYAAQEMFGDAGLRQANRAHGAAPHGVFPCAGEDQWCAIAIRSDEEWRALCAAMGAASLAADARFSTPEARKANEDELDALIAGWTRSQDKHALAARLASSGAPAGAVQDGRDVFTDPDLRAAGHYVQIEHPVLGVCDMPGPPMIFSDLETRVGPPPRLGEHNHEVFIGLLGMAAKDVEDLIAAGALA
jgi:benzylsuccinate CoA-transferase BbsF subunit